jgi:hypothetical protein
MIWKLPIQAVEVYCFRFKMPAWCFRCVVKEEMCRAREWIAFLDRKCACKPADDIRFPSRVTTPNIGNRFGNLSFVFHWWRNIALWHLFPFLLTNLIRIDALLELLWLWIRSSFHLDRRLQLIKRCVHITSLCVNTNTMFFFLISKLIFQEFLLHSWNDSRQTVKENNNTASSVDEEV